MASSGYISIASIRGANVSSSAPVVKHHNLMHLQSGTEGELDTPILTFDDANVGDVVEQPPIQDPSFHKGHVSRAELSEFLSRPVLIQSYEWAEGAFFPYTEFSPWANYFGDARIKRKIDNYAFMSCTLRLKVMINASPFYYGLALLTYRPLVNTADNGNGFRSAIADLSPINRTTEESQLPHIWLYPQSNQGGEMVLPYINFKNWLNVLENQSLARFGTCTLSSQTPLDSATNTTGTTATIQIYAWAENVKLAGPTVELSLQSKTEYDNTGVISAPASAIAGAMGRLSDVPIIGKYATASAMIASGVGNLASLFGFSNVANIENVSAFKELPFHAFATSEISTPIDRLCLDPKNELSIDPRVVGADGIDELEIKNFVAREAYLRDYPWALSDVPNTLLFASRVVPSLATVVFVSGNRHYRSASPMAYASDAFRFWRGDIIFRFRFICTKYHRGRVRITYDPAGNIISDLVSSTVAFTRIVDISKESDIEIRVPYMQDFPWLTVPTDKVDLEEYGGSAYAYRRQRGVDNGTITVRVFTKGSAPLATAPISVAVSVRGAENMEFAGPTDVPLGNQHFELQSLTENENEMYGNPTLVDIAGGMAIDDNPNSYLINHGEKIVSLRQIMRRTTLHRSVRLSGNTASVLTKHILFMSRYPLPIGWDPNGINTANSQAGGSAGPYTFAFPSFQSHFAPCFVGQRGSMRWNVNVDTPNLIGSIRMYMKNQGRIASDYNQSYDLLAPTNSTLSRDVLNRYFSGGTGMTLGNQNTQTGIGIEAPLFSQYRMQSTNPRTIVLGTTNDGSNEDTLRLEIVTKPNGSTTVFPSTTVDLYTSIGTDYSLIFFQCVPTVMYKATIPTGV